MEAGHPEASGLNAGDGKNEAAAVAAASDSEMMPGMAFMMEVGGCVCRCLMRSPHIHVS